MKKNIKIIVFLLISTFIFPKLSFADALLTPLNITQNSVTLKAENLTKNTSVILGIVNKNSGTVPYSEYKKTISNNKGEALADFTGLSQGEEYVGSVFYDGSVLAGSVAFSTKAGMSIEIRDVRDTSVTILAKNFPPKKEINFIVTNFDYQTPKYMDTQDVITDESGIALYQFFGLSKGGHYRYSHSESNKTGSFYTTGSVSNSSINNNSNNVGNYTQSSDPGGLVPCGTSANPQPCEFKHILELINKVINFILFVIAVPLSAIMFAYAGFLLVFSGGSSEKMSQAKSIFLNVVIGLVIVAAAWLIVHTILNIVGFDGSWIGL